MENPFEFHEEDTIIACVGDNGGTTDEDIRNGFKRTVELLTESLKTGSEVEDLLVYPIVYNARHSIELSLKIVIKMLWRIEEKKGICYSEEVLKERKKELHTHSIECLYKLACDKKNIDRRIPAYFENIEDMIYFYYFDEEGDAFKYELNKEDEPHMIKNKISHVSIELLETEFKEVMKKFDDLIYFLDNCIFEYSLGTFTKSLSRADISYEKLQVEQYVTDLHDYWKDNRTVFKLDSVSFLYIWGSMLTWTMITALCLIIGALSYSKLPTEIPVQWSKGVATSLVNKNWIFICPVICIIIRYLLKPFIYAKLQMNNYYGEIITEYLTNYMCFIVLSVEIFSILFTFGVVKSVVVLLFVDTAIFIGLLVVGLVKMDLRGKEVL